MQCALDGTMYTNHGKNHRKNAEDSSQRCPFCSEKDGYHHRLWQCPHFADLRMSVAGKYVPEVPHLPLCHVNHAWAIKPASHITLLAYFDAIQPFDICNYRLDLCKGSQVDMFVDGSCVASPEPALRCASWAVTVAHWEGSPLDHSVLAAGWVPGIHQTAFRGELEAMAHALAMACLLKKPCRIWSDCQGVVTGVRRLQQGIWRLTPNMSHFDKWEQIQQSLHAFSDITVMQVYSHIEPGVGSSYLEFWVFWHNSLVDMAAGRVNEARGSVFWDLWNQCERELLHGRQRTLAIANLIVATGRRADQSTTKPAKAAPSFSGMNADGVVAQVVSATKRWVIPNGVAVKFGHPAVAWVHQWWSHTGQVFLRQSATLHWVSFLQLYIDFQLSTGQGGPLLWKSKWFFGEQLRIPDFAPGYIKRCKWFQMLLKKYWSGNHFEFRSRSIRPASGAICCWLVTAQIPWPQERLDQIDGIILEQTNTGPVTT